jgi:hypothetical protein
MTVRLLCPASRMATAPTNDSGRLEKKIATSNVNDTTPTSDTPSATFSGTPSKVTARAARDHPSS